MTKLAKVLNASDGIDEDQFNETINQNSLFPVAYNSDLFLASDIEDEDDDDDEFEEEDEDVFDEDELSEDDSYEEDFDFDEDEDDDVEDEDVGTYNWLSKR
jgi:hypothetical protein